MTWVKEDIEEYGDNGGYDCGFALRMLKAQEKTEKWFETGSFPDVPVALFTGTKDEICSPEGCYFAKKHIKQSNLFTYEGAYHALAAELPETVEKFYEDLTSWLTSTCKLASQ